MRPGTLEALLFRDPYAPRRPRDLRHTPQADALTEVILEVFRFSGLIEQEGMRLSQPVGQSTARWRVLGAVMRAGGQESVADLARRLGLTRQAVQRTVRALKRDGLVEYGTNPKHQRSPWIRLTTKGDRVLRSLGRAQIKWSNRHADRLDVAQLARAADLLRRVSDQVNGDPTA